jgi:serine acetyltransferase
MDFLDRFALKVKRAETPFYRFLNRSARGMLGANLPVPAFLKPVLRGIYELHWTLWQGGRMLLSWLIWTPMFRARCASIGAKFTLVLPPKLQGQPVIHAGDNVAIHGHVEIIALGDPGQCELILGNGVQIGHRVTFVIARRIVLGDHAGVASDCYVTDTSAIAEEILNGARTIAPDEPQPVQIGARAWVGRGSSVLKGVQIGEGAIVGAGSVVSKDIPPFSIAMGNPARVVVRNTPAA